MAMDSRRSVGKFAESIQSLLELKKRHTPSWADSVCSIMKSLPSERPSEDNKNDNKDANLGKAIFKIKDELDNLKTNIFQLNIQRRQVLDDFLDLKGNIRVFCRLRPFMMGENLENPRVVALDSNGVLLKFAEKKSKLYNFDRVFQPSSSQDDIFEEVEPVIKSALDGYNACIFAYGQTGTGKTFTMEGTPDSPGLVPRTIEVLFKQASDSNHTFLFNFSMIEIYRGHLRDLLIPRTTRVTDPMPPCLSIHTDTKGEIEIDNLVTIQVSDYNQAIKMYRLGCQFRSTASTNSNKSSSRSHCMIRISMTCFDATERRRETNKLWMVDLGGSERILKTKACGRRLEEGKAINLSLSALGDVINALQSKKCHIPYRNSKLTQVLKDSLGEDSKTLMLVHVSPKEEDLCETICSLNFATRVRSIHQGNEESTEARAQKEVAMTNLQQKMKQIENKRHEVGREIKKLKEKLENLLRTPLPSTDQLEDTHLSSQVPQLNTEPVEKIGNVAAAPSSELPRFMRPTICSRRKSGIDHIPLKKTDLVPARRRKPTSQHAESVNFPIKDLSEYNSDSSISRTSCFVGLNLKCSAENETTNSQDTSESDVKMVIFPEQGQSLRNSNHQTANLDYCEGHGNSFPKFLKVKDWLQSHKNTPSIRSQNHQSKRILAIPTPKKKVKDNGQRTEEKLPDDKLYDYQITKRKIMFDKFNKHADEEIAGRLISETVTDITPTVLKDFVHEDSRSNSIFQSCKSDGIIMMQARSVAEDMLIEDKKCSASTPPDKWCGRLNKKENDNGVNEIPMQEKTCETQCLEAFMLTKSWGCSSYTSDINHSLIRSTEDFNVPVSGSELISQCQMVPNEVGKNSEDEDLHVSAQPSEAGTTSCLYKLRSHRGLPIDTANEEDLTTPFTKLQENRQHTGIYDLLKQKIQILCISALLGLGFQSLGFGDDFFYALML